MKTKTYQYQVTKLMLALMATLFLVNCSNNDDGGGSKPAPVNSYYQVVGNQCMQNANGQLTTVDQKYCENTGTNTFYYSSGANCYLRSSNGTITTVSSTYCSSNGNTNSGQYQFHGGVCYQLVNGSLIPAQNPSLCSSNNGAIQTTVCNGAYTDDYQTVNCGTQFNCSGYTLRNVYTGQVHRCQ